MKRQRQLLSVSALIVAAFGGSSVALASLPTNTSLPGGWSWQPLAGGTYDTGTVGTPRGGFNGQTTGPFNDTSYGVMNEPSTPWFTGGDLSAQQYIQRQAFGNFGTVVPPTAPGFRNFNFAYTGPNGPTVNGPLPTGNGQNFPATAAERRSVSINNWNNAFPDAGGMASFGQIVYVPISASLTVGQGFGGDEMVLRAIGGNNGGTSEFRIDANINSRWSTSSFGSLTNSNNTLNVNGIVRFNDPGASFGSYEMPWGFNSPLAAGQISLTRASGGGFVLDQGTNIGVPGAGIGANSVGVGLSDSYNVLSGLLQNGSAASFTFDSAAEIFVNRNFGNADGRAQMGPGMEGTVRLVVQYAAYQAIPAPASAGLLAIGGLVALRRRR